MPDKENSVSMTKTELQQILTAAIMAANQPNPLEKQQMEEQAERERRRQLLAVELGKAEEAARWHRQNSCTHSRSATTGVAVERGTGVYTTSGQQHSDGSVSLVCMRCATIWRFMPNSREDQFLKDGGELLGFPPPPIGRLLNRDDFVVRPVPTVEVSQ